MVNMIKRMTKLQALLAIRLGPGAAVLPPKVTRIHMEFAYNDRGPRKFWQNYLPRLKYHNPRVPMTVTRPSDPDAKTKQLLTVHFSGPTSHSTPTTTTTTTTTTTATPDSDPHTRTILMKKISEDDILAKLMTLTTATPVEPTAQELSQMAELREARIKSDEDAERMKIVLAARRREEAILKEARSAMESISGS